MKKVKSLRKKVTLGKCTSCFNTDCKFCFSKINKGITVCNCKDFISIQTIAKEEMK